MLSCLWNAISSEFLGAFAHQLNPAILISYNKATSNTTFCLPFARSFTRLFVSNRECCFFAWRGLLYTLYTLSCQSFCILYCVIIIKVPVPHSSTQLYLAHHLCIYLHSRIPVENLISAKNALYNMSVFWETIYISLSSYNLHRQQRVMIVPVVAAALFWCADINMYY